jgi:hypothetical protein
MTFEQWLICIGKSPKSAKNYLQAIEGSISKWAKNAAIIEDSIINIRDLNEFTLISEKIKVLDSFLSFDVKGKGMYSAAIKHYAAYLDELTGQTLTDDIASIVSEKNISETTRSNLINARLGQGQFRKELLNFWKSCSITSFNNPRFLIASHIKPWRIADNKERLDVNNGLLLLPNHDKAFDLGYISFTNEGKILISDSLEKAEDIGIKKCQSIFIKEEHKFYLKFHRDHVFENFIDATGRQ